MALRAVKPRRNFFLLFTAFLVTGSNVWATDSVEEDQYFKIKKAETSLVDDIFRLSADIDFHLSKEAKEALQSGVPLVLEIKIEVLQERSWIWNALVAKLAQRYRVHYHALSQRYLLKNLNTGVQSSFRTLDGVLHVIGTLKDFPMLDKHILESAQSYIGKLRADLDIEALPTPIRLWAYSSPKWRLGSGWYEWQLQP
jgi:hypothetical protein